MDEQDAPPPSPALCGLTGCCDVFKAPKNANRPVELEMTSDQPAFYSYAAKKESPEVSKRKLFEACTLPRSKTKDPYAWE